MPIYKPTIAHQLKTVKNSKPKNGSVIHTTPNMIATMPHTRSHLRGGNTIQWRKSSYDRSTDVIDVGDISHSDLQRCTRILRNVLANEENKSTSTDDCIAEGGVLNSKFVEFKSPDLCAVTDRPSGSEKFPHSGDPVSDLTEVDSLTSVWENKPNATNTSNQSRKISCPGQEIFCTCQTDSNNTDQMHETKKVAAFSDGSRVTNDKVSVCARCHNIIPQANHFDKDGHTVSNSKMADHTLSYQKFQDIHNCKSHFPSNTQDYKTPINIDNCGDEKIDNIVGIFQIKLHEIGLIARATRDADLDRLVCEIDRAFQQIIRENSLVFSHLKTITKTVKWDNSGLKQKVKNLSETNRDLKSEIRLLRQENKQKIDELKLEMQLKDEELRQWAQRDKSDVNHWREKYQHLEKEHERIRSEFQAQVLQLCHKDTEIIQMKHLSSQSEAKLKEQIHSLMLTNQNLQTDVLNAQEANKKYEHECQHNQSIIKSAREHVINLLERHRQGRDGAGSVSYKYDPFGDTPMNGSGDWINQATSLQQVLSMVSDNRDPYKLSSPDSGHNLAQSSENYCPSSSKQYDQSRSMMISPINYATTNYNNNYVSSSSCNPNISDLSKQVINESLDAVKFVSAHHGDQPRSSSPSDVSSTISQNSSNFSHSKVKQRLTKNINDKQYKVDVTHCKYESDNGIFDDSWNLDVPSLQKAKMSSASSVMSTVSSLQSTDDREFRGGLQRLDSQISKLQTTLQSKMLCKS